jgi:hypothetical protein
MTVQEVLKALSGELHWFRAAEILGWSPRTVRRWQERYEEFRHSGLIDKRLHRPSLRQVAPAVVEQVLRLCRECYQGSVCGTFIRLSGGSTGDGSYSFVKQALQAARLVKKHRARGRHRLRREPRACFGEMLHLDGSVHEWFTGEDFRPCLIAVSDDATKRGSMPRCIRVKASAVMTSLATVLRTARLPMALYTDRAHWAFHIPKAKEPVDKTRLTQVGRALARLGFAGSEAPHE